MKAFQQNHHFAPVFTRFRLHNVNEITRVKAMSGNNCSVEVDFDEPLSVVLPTSLQQLRFSEWSNFNHPVEASVLPLSLQQLTLGRDFNHLITAGVLPSSLQQLNVGDDFDHPISAGVLPSSLQQLTFSE